MWLAIRLLFALLSLYRVGPMARSLRSEPMCIVRNANDRLVREKAPPAIDILVDLVRAADDERIPASVLLSTCVMESGLNPCAVYCGVLPRFERWTCSQGGARCEAPAGSTPMRLVLYRQIRAAAWILKRQHDRVHHWGFAAQGFHQGNAVARLRPCLSNHSHRWHYAVQALWLARRYERVAVVRNLPDEELRWLETAPHPSNARP